MSVSNAIPRDIDSAGNWAIEKHVKISQSAVVLQAVSVRLASASYAEKAPGSRDQLMPRFGILRLVSHLAAVVCRAFFSARFIGRAEYS